MYSCKLTVCFDGSFWVALVENKNEKGETSVARHVFGSEPNDSQVEEFIHDHWYELHFCESLKVEKVGGKSINYKRLQRVIEKEIAANASKGTKSQQAIAQEREASKVERKHKSKQQKQAEAEEKRKKLKEKHKKKHKGH